jgi:hypothetical protein
MGGWLQKIMAPTTTAKKDRILPIRMSNKGQLPAQPFQPGASLPCKLPNATVIYGIGASLMFVASFSLLLAGRWFSGIMVFFLGGCFTGFALHLLKHQD